MNRTLLLLVIGMIVPQAAFAADGDEGFVPLFNGRDLAGWVPCNVATGTDGKDTFTVKDGMIVCTGKPTGVMRTERMYENFVVELEWRHMVPKGNSGFFLWADDITSTGVPFSRGLEVQILDGPNHPQRNYTTHGDLFPIHGATAKPDHPGKFEGRSYPTEDRSKPSPEWNHYRIEAVNGNVTLAVNGKVVNSTKEVSPRKGYLCLESEGGVVHFRNIRIKELPPAKELDPKHVAIADRGFKSIYTGVDLSGWTSDSTAWSSRDWMLHFELPQNSKETPAGAYALRSVGAYKDFEWVVDYRQAAAGPVGLIVGGRTVTVTPAAAAKPGWRRLAIRCKGSEVKATVDGTAADTKVEGEAPADGGAIGLNPSVTTDFANVYVRKLE